MPYKNPLSLDRNLPLWQFMLARRSAPEEQKFREYYLEADINQILSISMIISVLLAVLTVTDIPQFAEISGLTFGAIVRTVMLLASIALFLCIKKWHRAPAIDLGIASFALLVAGGIVAFHMISDVSTTRIGTVGTLFIFVTNITFPVYSLYMLPAVLLFLIGDSIAVFSPHRITEEQNLPIIVIVFLFAELISVIVSAHLQRTRYLAFRAFTDVKTLSGMIPICSHCNKIRDDSGYYQQLEKYISAHSNAKFSHGICPDCMDNFYPEAKEQHKPKAK